MDARQRPHRVQVSLHLAKEISSLADCLGKPGEGVGEVGIVAFLGLRSVCRLRLTHYVGYEWMTVSKFQVPKGAFAAGVQDRQRCSRSRGEERTSDANLYVHL